MAVGPGFISRLHHSHLHHFEGNNINFWLIVKGTSWDLVPAECHSRALQREALTNGPNCNFNYVKIAVALLYFQCSAEYVMIHKRQKRNYNFMSSSFSKCPHAHSNMAYESHIGLMCAHEDMKLVGWVNKRQRCWWAQSMKRNVIKLM